MKLVRAAIIAAAGIAALPLGSVPASAQAMAGRQLPDRPVVSVGYYKTPPGQQDEWLALYLKWHRPIMDYQISQGVTVSSTVYANASHSETPAWDFMIVNVSPPPGRAKKLGMTRGEVIAKLFPDLDAYTAGEKSRWAMTVAHWDQDVMEVDLKAAHPGIYYPMLPAGK